MYLQKKLKKKLTKNVTEEVKSSTRIFRKREFLFFVSQSVQTRYLYIGFS